MRNEMLCIEKRDLGSEGRAADALAPAPGQGEGWGGGRNLAGAVPAFDPHPSLPPARGKVQFPPASAPPTGRAIRFFANAAARQGCGMLMRNKTFCSVESRVMVQFA